MGFDAAVADAFAGRLLAAERRLNGFPDDEPSRWLRAYLAAARGMFGPAELLAAPLAIKAADPEVRRAASVTLASVLRQTGRHADARAHDARALRLSKTPSARAHALVGLAADAVGMGARRVCAERVRAAGDAAPRGDWRAWTRVYWVRAEYALLTEDPWTAVAAARAAVRRARAAGAARHTAKSLLFLGASLEAAGDPGARPPLVEAERTAARIGAAPIASVARDLLTRLQATGAR